MNQFSIRDIENLCGVKAHTLRIWEQRYGFFVPKRKESQHRIYDCDDLKQLLRICFLYHNGYKISRIAELSPDQIQDAVAQIKPQGCNYEMFVHQLIEAGIKLDKENFESVIDNLILRIGLEKTIFYVFYPFLERIGLLWMTNHVVPAQEHFASHIITRKIICAIDGLEAVKKSDHHVVIFSPVGELHEIPLLVVNYLLLKNGIRTTYFGPNVAIETLDYYTKYNEATHFYMHTITYLENCGIKSRIDELISTFPGKKLILSGPACSCTKGDDPNFQHIQSLDELLQFAEQLNLSPEPALI